MLEVGEHEGGFRDIADAAGTDGDGRRTRQRPTSRAKPRSPKARIARSNLLQVRLSMPSRRPILRQFPRQNPRGVSAFIKNGLVESESPGASRRPPHDARSSGPSHVGQRQTEARPTVICGTFSHQ